MRRKSDSSKGPEGIRIPTLGRDLIYSKTEIIKNCRHNLLRLKASEDYMEEYAKQVAATGERLPQDSRAYRYRH
jgi:hypothetical protein